MTFRSRIIFAFILLSLIVIGSFSIYIYSYYSSYRKELFISRLTSKADVIQSIDNGQGNEDELSNALIYTDLLTLFEERVVLLNSNYDVIYTNILEQRLVDRYVRLIKRTNVQSGFVYKVDSKHEIIITKFLNGNMLLNGAIDILGIDKMNNLRSTLLLGNVFAIGMAFFLGLLFAEAIVKPLNRITKVLNRISDKDLNTRLELAKGKDEIHMISKYFNTMMNRLQRSFINQKNFISHASHEMRTPLAKVLINLEALQKRSKKGSFSHKNLQQAIDDTKITAELVNGLLQLALVSKEEELEMKENRLDDVILVQLSKAKEKYPEVVLNFEIKNMDHEFEPILGHFNIDLFPIAIYNLIENALKYSNGNPVNISLVKSDKVSTVIITDRGVGILAGDLKFIFEPLYRGTNSSEQKGFGIGLSLVQRIFDLHQIKISVVSEPQKGTAISFDIKSLEIF
jgi:signal transduction histidine kinase